MSGEKEQENQNSNISIYEQTQELIKKIKKSSIPTQICSQVLTHQQMQNYIDRLKLCQEIPCWEERHAIADNLLCELLNNIGLNQIVEEYSKMEKWYA